ncbi:putative actin binding protein, partial [Trypoxylus dichotomus]
FVDHDTNYEYDLTGLYRPWSGAWPVRNRSNKPIRMNICGPLVGEIAGECEDKSSQICGRILTDDDLSYGTVLVDKSAKDDTLKARLVYGSPCPANDSVMLSANLNWRCSFEEMEPTLVRLHDCSVDILWETPRACPKHTVASSTLNIHDHLGNRDLTDLCVGDRNHTLDPSSYIRYNLCARLGSSCAGMRDVSACLHLHEKQMILGN